MFYNRATGSSETDFILTIVYDYARLKMKPNPVPEYLLLEV